MNAYEQLKTELMTALNKHFSFDQLQTIANELDRLAIDYDVKKAEKALTIRGRDEAERLAKSYIVVRGMEGISPKTLETYWGHLARFAKWVKKPIAELTTNDLRMYLFEYQQKRSISNRSLEGVRGCIATFFRWVAAEGYIPSDPACNLKAIKYEIKPRQALDQIELEYIRRACRTPRETAIIEVLYSTGCRVSELSRVKLGDINWHTGEVQLLGKGNKYRVSYINAKAEVAIREYLRDRKHDSVYLFCNERGGKGGQPMQKDNIEKVVRQISRRCTALGKEISPHIMRHTMATQAVRSGMPVQDIQQLLGHSNIATTMIYAKTSKDSVAAGHKRCVI